MQLLIYVLIVISLLALRSSARLLVFLWGLTYPEELQLCKENTDKHEASFLDLDIKIKDGRFHFGLFDKRDSFPFSIVRMPEMTSKIPSSIVYSAIGAESLRIARASNDAESFSTAIKPSLNARMSRVILKLFD